MTDLANAGKVQFISGQVGPRGRSGLSGDGRPAGRNDPAGLRFRACHEWPQASLSQCSDGRPVRVRGNRKDKKHELHSMWPPVEASAKMRMRPVATLRESSGSTLPKSFPLLEEPPMPMGWGIADFCLIKRLCTPGQGRCWKGPGGKKSLACPHSLENAQVGVGDSFPLARPPAPKPSACRP